MVNANITFHWNFIIVTGDANFSMKYTSLTVGGFNQPSVARSLIELPWNAEKGLSQRFLWFFPRPVYAHFATLEPVNKTFTEKIGMLLLPWGSTNFMISLNTVDTLARLWRKTTMGHSQQDVFYSTTKWRQWVDLQKKNTMKYKKNLKRLLQWMTFCQVTTMIFFFHLLYIYTYTSYSLQCYWFKGWPHKAMLACTMTMYYLV